MPKHAIKAAGGRFYVDQSVQEKLLVAGSLYIGKNGGIRNEKRN